MDVGIIFGQMLVLFAMMLIGYFVYRKQWIAADTAGSLSKMVVNVFNPILVINGVLGQNRGAGMDNIRINLLFIILYFVVLILYSFLILFFLRPGRHKKSIYRLMTIFSNLGFMGIPVVRSIYGNEAMIYIAFYILAYNLLLYTYGMALTKKAAAEYRGTEGNKAGWKESFQKMQNPGVAAALLAVIIFMSGVEAPDYISTFCDYMGNATIPLSMILIGISVAETDLKKVFLDIRIYAFIIFRMVALPIFMIFLLRNIPVDTVIFGVFIIELGMPVGSIISLMARESGADADYCTKGVVLSTLASILTIPFVCAFL